MLVEMAVADAYAIAWEFTDKQMGFNDLSDFYQHPTYAELLPGQYTDDTQRAISNVEVLLSRDPGAPFNPMAYGCSLVEAYKRDPREGYSRGFQALLKSVDNGGLLLNNVKRTKASNGAVMGVAPLGFIHDVEGVKLAATIQAISTHHPSTAVHAQLIALSAHFFLHSVGSQTQLVEFLMDSADWLDKSDERSNWLGQMAEYHYDATKPTTIKASSISAYVAYAVSSGRFETLSDIIKDAVERGGDTDSAAASATAVASTSPEFNNDIPQHLLVKLDAANPGFGTEFLNDLENSVAEEPYAF